MAVDRIDPSEQISEEDLVEPQAPIESPLSENIPVDIAAHPEPVDGTDLRVDEADPLVDVVVRVYADFADRVTLAEILEVVGRCRGDLDTQSAAALPEMVERLARQRLTDQLASPGAGERLPS
jgi:hypothetical protein